jgi:general secretion pathway protein G
MMKTTFRRAAKGFTLIELLIVVIIIAILAAIAIPQFSGTSGDAQESASVANLTNMRSAIELYRVQHNNTFPSKANSKVSGTLACTGGTAGTGDADTEQAFKDQLTMYSDAAGHTCSVAAAGYSFGPYLRAIPVEPITNVSTVTVVTAAANTPADDTATTGWRFLNTTGALQINTSRKARDGQTKLADK